jgi:hypothetical protein
VNLLRRKASSQTEPVTKIPDDSDSVGSESADGQTSKGRPTPKRRANGKPIVAAPRTRKEAAAWQKEYGARAKVAGQKKMTTEEYRVALKKGDPRVLPRRDAGPVKLLARNWVDSRRMLSNYLLWLFVLMFVGYIIHPLQIATLAIFVVIILEWMFAGSRIRKIARDRGLDVRDSAFSIGFYAGSRAYLPRRWRRPEPMVALGDPI